jgi:hypothetical protein
MVTIRCRTTKALQMARTVRTVTSLIVVIARRDAHGQEYELALAVPVARREDRRRPGPFRSPAPLAAATLAPWHEHEEDD